MPKFDASDEFYLNGQRLIPCEEQPGGGADDTCPPNTFRTEQNDFSRVEVVTGTTPVTFEITKPDGTVLEYGQVQTVPGANGDQIDEIHAWYLTRVLQHGNEVRYTYVSPTPYETYLSTIEYGGQDPDVHPTPLAHVWKITFDRSPSTDGNIVTRRHDRGVREESTYRLDRVRIESRKAGGSWQEIHEYQLQYGSDPVAGLVLDAVIQKDPTDESPSPDMSQWPTYSFEYGPPTGGWTGPPPSTWWSEQTSFPAPLEYMALAFNGDFPDTPGQEPPRRRDVRLVDVNRDGRADLVRHHYDYRDSGMPAGPLVWAGEDTYVWSQSAELEAQISDLESQGGDLDFSTMGSYDGDNSGIPYEPTVDQGVRYADLNGDGHLDLLQAYEPESSAEDPVFRVAIYDPDMGGTGGYDEVAGALYAASLEAQGILFQHFEQDIPNRFTPGGAGTVLLDVNGDRQSDVIVAMQWSGRPDLQSVYLNNGEGFTPAPPGTWELPYRSVPGDLFLAKTVSDPPLTYPQVEDCGVRFGDLNGDGLPDIVQLHGVLNEDPFGDPQRLPQNQERGVWLNTGSGWEAAPAYEGDLLSAPLDELFLTDTLRRIVGITPPIRTVRRNFATGVELVDVNSDGLADLVQAFRYGDDYQASCDPPDGQCEFAVYLNLGPAQGFSTVSSEGWELPDVTPLAYSNREGDADMDPQHLDFDMGVRLADLDSDGDLDIFQYFTRTPDRNDEYRIYANLANDNQPAMRRVVTPQGGYIDVDYDRIIHRDSDAEPPAWLTVVNKIRYNNRHCDVGDSQQDECALPIGSPGWVRTEQNFTYLGGEYDTARREFTGFRLVSIADGFPGIGGDAPVLHTTTWYATDPEERCRLGQVEMVAQSREIFVAGSDYLWDEDLQLRTSPSSLIETFGLFRVTEYQWAGACESVEGPHFAPPTTAIQRSYEASASAPVVSTKRVTAYDEFGGVTNHWEYADEFAAAAYRRVETAYGCRDLDRWIVNKPTATLSYDELGQLQKVLSYQYDESICGSWTFGDLTRVDHTGFVDGVFDGSMLVEQYRYTEAGNLRKTIDADLNETTIEWDSEFPEVLPRATVNALLQTTTMSYDDYGNLITTVDPNLAATSLTYDAFQRPVTVTTSHASLSTGEEPEVWYAYEYDRDLAQYRTMRFTKSGPEDVDGGGAFVPGLLETSYRAGLGREYLQTTQAVKARQQGGEAVFEPESGAPTLCVARIFNDRGFVSGTTISYEGVDLYPGMEGDQFYDRAQPKAERTYDATGRVTVSTAPGQLSTLYSYGLRSDQGVPMHWIRTTFDNGGSLQARDEFVDSLGRVARVTICEKGGCTNPDDATNVITTRYEYDARDNLARVCLPDGGGDCASGATQSLRFYDGLGRVVAIKDPDRTNCLDSNLPDPASGCPLEQEYDSRGLRSEMRDAEGRTTTFDYDALGRLTEEHFVDASDDVLYTYVYDQACGTGSSYPTGRLTSATRVATTFGLGTSTVTDCYRYDVLGRLTAQETSITMDGGATETAEVSYTYGPDGVTEGAVVSHDGLSDQRTYDYDLLRRSQALQSSLTGTVASSIAHRADGRLGGYTLGNGVSVTHSFRESTDLRLSEITAGSALGLYYDYDPAGNITSILDDHGGIYTYNYDKLNRLNGFTRGGKTRERYMYDKLSRRILKAEWDWGSSDPPIPGIENPPEGGGSALAGGALVPGGGPLAAGGGGGASITNYTIHYPDPYLGDGVLNAPTCIGLDPADCSPSTTAFGYDVHGNMTSRADLGSTQVLTYNDAHQIETVTTPSSAARYVYGPDGSKVATVIDGVTRYFFGSELEILDGDPIFYYALGSRRLARRQSDGSVVFFVTDHLSSVRAVLDDSGSALGRLHYMPFGEKGVEGTYEDDLYAYHGSAEDMPGIYDYRARSYMPDVGILMQADTIVPGVFSPPAWNRYSYVLNNPLRYRDPSGRLPYWSDRGVWHGTRYGWICYGCDGDSPGRAGGVGGSGGAGTGGGAEVSAEQFAANEEAVETGNGDAATMLAIAASGALQGAERVNPGVISRIGGVVVRIPAGLLGVLGIIATHLQGDAQPSADRMHREEEQGGETGQEEGGEEGDESTTGKENTPDQDAVIQIAKEAKRKGGLTPDEAAALIELANEAGVLPVRGPESHPGRSYTDTHIHIGPINHIPVR